MIILPPEFLAQFWVNDRESGIQGLKLQAAICLQVWKLCLFSLWLLIHSFSYFGLILEQVRFEHV